MHYAGGSILISVMACEHIALLSAPNVWWRKPYGGLDGQGISPKGRYERSPESIEVSSPGKLRVFSKSPIGALGIQAITLIRMLTIQV
jgi:hypothetical protein